MASIYVKGHILSSLPTWNEEKYGVAYISFTAGETIAYLRVVDRLGKIYTDPDTGLHSYGDNKTIWDEDGEVFYNMTWYLALTEEAATQYSSLFPGINTKTWVADGEEDYRLNMSCDSGPYWSNQNLYDGNGALFLAGSTPEIYPVTEESGDGFALFNGHKLPVMPSINTSLHPNVSVQRIPYDDGGYIAHVRCGASPFYYDDATGVVTNDGDCIVYDYINWYKGSEPVWTGAYTVEGGSLALQPETIIWTNVQMLDSTGAVWMETSEVIPLDGLMVTEWDGRINHLKTLALEGRTYYRMSAWTPTSTEFAGTYTAVGNNNRLKNYLWTAESIAAGDLVENETFMYMIDTCFSAHSSGRLTYRGSVLSGVEKGLYSCLTLIAYDPIADGAVYAPGEGEETGDDVIEEEPEVVETLTPAEERQILLLGWQAGNAIRRTLTQTNVNAVLVNGVLYIKDAEATLNDTTLEVK